MQTATTNCKSLRQLAAFALAGACLSTPHAALVISMQEAGGNVVATGSGRVNTAGLTFDSGENPNSFVFASLGFVCVGPNAEFVGVWSGPSGPTAFGTGGFLPSSTGLGDHFYVAGVFSRIALPLLYTSGAPLSGSATWNGQTLATLGLTPGSYTWTWGTGGDADSLTVNIGPVPEPAQWALLSGLGLVGFGVWRRRSAS